MTFTKTITIDPRIFISKPFTKCPKCGKEEYGTLSVNGTNYTKRCRSCWYTEGYKLPAIDKKVIYLDQFVISNMMKAINDKIGKKDKVQKIYLKLFEVLDRLVKLQLIVCPDSTFHREESMLSTSDDSLRRMYEHLSHNTSFYDPATIRRFQLSEDYKNNREGIITDWKKSLDTDDVLQGDRNAWQSRMRVSVHFPVKSEEVTRFRDDRRSINESVRQLFNGWQKEGGRSFSSFYKELSLSWGEAVVKQYGKIMTDYLQMSLGIKNANSDDIFSITGEVSILITSLLRYISDDENDADKYKQVFKYLKSERLSKVPFNEINSAAWSAIAYQASKGGRTKNPPNVGMLNDIDMVSTLFPYCDAMFVDRDMHSILKFGGVATILKKYKGQLFSLSNVNEFIAYLEGLESNAPKMHAQLVAEIYGVDWATPYYEMYEHENNNKKSSLAG